MSDGDTSPAAGEPSSAPWPDSPTRPDDTPGAEIPGGFHDEFPELGLTAKASGPPVISAEWALWGKEAHETGYHVLRCSGGPLRARDFSEIITRYSPGELDGLPQYTVSWIPGADREPEYVAIGIHEPAPADPRPADRRSRRDAVGREIVFVRLFCMRYADLAEHAASYQDVVRAAQDVQFPVNSGREVGLTLAAASSPIIARGTARRLAERVAALLLTGDQVCVLGADDVSAAERLRFVDTVMAMLPYGLRATMSASTWAASTSQSLKLRLFFSGVPRAGGRLTDGRAQARDRLVEWTHPDDIHVTGEAALLYQDWLKGVRSQAAELLAEQARAGRAAPVRFRAADIRRMVGNLPTDKGIPETLDDLAVSLLHADQPAIRSAIRRLQRYLASGHKLADLADCRRRIRDGRLLANDDRLTAALKGDLYDVLLRLAFGVPLTYAGYCALEDCVGVPLSAPLRSVLARTGATDALAWILARESRPGSRSDKTLTGLHSEGVRAAKPLELVVAGVAGEVLRVGHGPIVLDYALRYLRNYSDNPGAVLAHYGYLVDEHQYIYRDDMETQVKQLTRVLRIAFGEPPLDRSDIDVVLGRPGRQPTVALEEAVARMTDRRNRTYIRNRVAEAALQARGFPAQSVLVREQRRWWPPRWPGPRRRDSEPFRHQGLIAPPPEFATQPGPFRPQQPTGPPGTVTMPVTMQQPEPAWLHQPVRPSGRVWEHPRTLLTVLLIMLVAFAVCYLVVQSLLAHG